MVHRDLKIVCWKWEKVEESFRYRETYTHEHVNNFSEMIRKNLTIPHEIVCITDDPTGIDKDIRIVPLWDDLKEYGMCYRRLKVFSEEMKDIIGPRFVSMDLDCVVTGPLDSLFDNDNDFMMWEPGNTHTPYCGSMFMMNAGDRSFIWDEFNEKDLIWLNDRGGWVCGKSNRWAHMPAYKAGFIVGSDQAYISYKLYPNEKTWAEKDGVYNFSKIQKSLPENSKLVFFPGKHDPNHEELYYKHPWIPKYYPGKDCPPPQLSCITFLWGSDPYNYDYVNRLFNSIDRHLSYPHKNICFTNKPQGIREGIEIKPLTTEWMFHNLKKVEQFNPNNGLTGRILSFDLDNVIVGSLDEFAENRSEFIICEAINKARKGRNGGNIMGFDAGYGDKLWRKLHENYPYYKRKTKGMERFLYDRVIPKMEFWPPGKVVSYRHHIKTGKADLSKVKIISFHGKPNPADVKDKIIVDSWV